MSDGVVSADQSAKEVVDSIEKLIPAFISQPSCTPTDKFSGHDSMRPALLACQDHPEELYIQLRGNAQTQLQQLLLLIS